MFVLVAEMVPKEVTVALIKPDIVKEGKAEEVLAKVNCLSIAIFSYMVTTVYTTT